MKKLLAFLLFTSILTLSCKPDAKKETSSAEKSEKIEKVKAKYTLTPFSNSQAYPDANMESVTFKNGKFTYNISEGDYKLGEQTPDAPQKMCANSGKGQHIHLIVDDNPYAAKYTNEFDYEIPDGDHYILSFLSRSYHESIKTDEARQVAKYTVKGNSFVGQKPIMDPMIFYSRPKGTYVGKKDTEKVMLDFYAVNANIGTTQKVIAKINGEEHEINNWQPYYITGLPMGENTVELTLVDNDGNKVDTPLNPVKRTFTLKEDPTE